MISLQLLRPRSLVAVIAILAIGVLFVAFGSLRNNSTAIADPDEVELITLRPAGIEPAEISRSKGPFVLFVDDRSGKEKTALELKLMNGERLRAISLQRKKSEWNEVVDLPPGTYVLQDGNSESRCQITILP